MDQLMQKDIHLSTHNLKEKHVDHKSKQIVAKKIIKFQHSHERSKIQYSVNAITELNKESTFTSKAKVRKSDWFARK